MSLRISTKLFIDGIGPSLSDYVPVFHGFIHDESLKEVLVDVADYSHVFDGPGIVLIGHEADYGLDLEKGRAGLKCQRKRAAEQPNEEAEVTDALSRLLRVAALLENDERLPGLKFGTQTLELRFADRLRFPATEAGEAFARRLIQNPLARLFPNGVTLTRTGSPKELLSFEARVAVSASLTTLLGRLN